MRKLSVILLLSALLATWSCRKELVLDEVCSGYGSIELSLSSQTAIRLETKSESDDLLEGLRFRNVLVILTDNSGKVVGKEYKEYVSSMTQDVIQFDHLLPGNYHAYAYANIDRTQWQDSDRISTQEKEVAEGSSFSAFLDRELLNMTTAGVDELASVSEAMLMTGDLAIPVGLSVISRTLELLRPVVRFNVHIHNHTPYPVTVKDLSFSQFSPDRAYILPHLDANGVPTVPAGATYSTPPAYDDSSPEVVAANSEQRVYQTLLYENVASSTYRTYVTLELDRSGESLSNLEVSMGERPFGPLDSQVFADMNDGESVDVLVINPRNAVRSGRLYYGIGDAGIAWESCGYSTYNQFLARALAIWDETSSFTYEDFSYNGVANDKSGQSGWTGNSKDDPSTSNMFHYTGARASYFRRLTKTDGLFTLSGLSVNAPSETSISGLNIVKGQYVKDKFPSDMSEADFFVRLQNSDNSKRLKSDCVWNSGDNPGNAKQSKLVWDTGNNQDHQFILFGKYCVGGALKRILKDNNKEVPLTYMARNEDINLVINVYYADQEGAIDFVVDNSHWTDAGTTTSSHTFN